ncbi:MAG: hypothetical protein H6672_17915 [Anaerolineaceae bacterium]|nr:hypothetical protein [Anaerolineaceae bacterium]
MTRERFLTVRWNNLMAVGLGIPAVIFVVLAFSTSMWTELSGLIGISIVGVVY